MLRKARLAIAILISLFLAIFGFAWASKLGVPTPGIFVVVMLQQHVGMFQNLGAIGWALVLQMAVDFVFWLSVFLASYGIVSRRKQKDSGSS